MKNHIDSKAPIFYTQDMTRGKKAILAAFIALSAVAISAPARAAQTNQLRISSTAIDAAMLSTFSVQQTHVSPSSIGEVTLPGSINDALSQGNQGAGVNDPTALRNIGNRRIVLVPERSTWSMMVLGSGMLVAMMRFRRRRHS